MSRKTNILKGIALKGVLGQFADLRGGLAKKEEAVFLSGGDTPMHTMHKQVFSPVGIVVLSVSNLRRKKVLWISEKMSQ